MRLCRFDVLNWLSSFVVTAFVAGALFCSSLVYAEEAQKSEEAEEATSTEAASSESEEQAEEVKDFVLPDGLEWETNNTDPTYTDPSAKKGGTFNTYIQNFPETLRRVGPQSNSAESRTPFNFSYFSLVTAHPNTGNVIPSLATHWAAAKDNKTVYYKLDLRARWSDGKPVTAEDYVFTREFRLSPHIQDPFSENYYTEEIVSIKVHAKDVISVVSGKSHAKKELIFTTAISPTPKHFHKLDKDWVRKYNFKVHPSTGPYHLSAFKKSHFLKVSRKKDWWGQDLRYTKNAYNVDHIYFRIIRDDEAIWQHFLKGDVHAHELHSAKYWHDKTRKQKPFDKGYIKKIWHYTDGTDGSSGFWLNQEQEHWKDKNVRHAFAHALNFDKVNKEILRGEFKRLQSFYIGYGKYSDPSIKARAYDSAKVAELMKASGYELNKAGYWAKDGKQLTVSVLYRGDVMDPQLALLKEEAKKAGFDMSLDKRDATTWYKMLTEKTNDVGVYGFANKGSVMPPRYWQFFHSDNAKKETNNGTMTRNPKLDKLIDEYRDTFDEEKKASLSREILQEIYNEGSFIPRFHAGFQRIGLWRYWKLPNPPAFKLTGFGSMSDRDVVSLVWFDEKAKAELERYQKEGKAFDDGLVISDVFKVKD